MGDEHRGFMLFPLNPLSDLSPVSDDCEMPQTCDTPLPSDSSPDDAVFSHRKWHTFKFRFTAILGDIADRAFAAKHPTYATIAELDKQINEFYHSLPAWMMCGSVVDPVKELRGGPGLGSPEDMRREAQLHFFSNMIFLALLHLHRVPFCRALTTDASDPLKARYESSVTRLTEVRKMLFIKHRV